MQGKDQEGDTLQSTGNEKWKVQDAWWKSTGPRTLEGLERSRRANWKHGYYSAESIAMHRYIRWLLRESREMIEKV